MNPKGSFRHCLLIAGTMFGSTPALDAGPLEERIAGIERQIVELKAMLVNRPAATPPAIAPDGREAAAEPPDVSVSPGTKLQFYGFVRFDASTDSGRIHPGNTAFYAAEETTSHRDAEWNLTAGTTRLGLNLSGPDTGTTRLTGNVEVDFLGGEVENASNPRMRHGYLKAYWPERDFSIVAGQTWDVLGTLIPFVDDQGLMRGAGNIGGRHPQLRFTKGFRAGRKGRFEMAAALSRSIGDTSRSDADAGKDASIPSVQGRLGLSVPVNDSGRPARIALSGHYGQEEWDTEEDGAHTTLESWSCVIELSIPLSDRVQLAGEYFVGSNLDDYWGGIRQGNAGPREIGAHGGWAALRYAVGPATTLGLGAGVDDPDDGDLAAGGRTLNETQFVSLTHRITQNFILGSQLSHWRTGYKGERTNDALRAQASVSWVF